MMGLLVKSGYSLRLRYCVPLMLLLVLLLAACEPAPTPFAVVPPTATITQEIAVVTSTPAPESTAEVTTLPASNFRYGIAPNMQGSIAELDLLEATGDIIHAPDLESDTLGRDYDILMAYGALEGWQQSPIIPTVTLVINVNAPPLNDNAAAALVGRSLNPAQIVDQVGITGFTAAPFDALPPLQFRTDMANAGYPDGLALVLGHTFIPGALTIAQNWAQVNIDTRVQAFLEVDIAARFESGDMHLGLIAVTSTEQRREWTARLGERNVIDLYTMPISYQSTPGLNISFTPGGLPIVES